MTAYNVRMKKIDDGDLWQKQENQGALDEALAHVSTPNTIADLADLSMHLPFRAIYHGGKVVERFITPGMVAS